MNTAADGLEVPIASHEAAWRMRRDLVDYQDLQAIAAPMVAAELLRLRDELCTHATQTRSIDIQTGLLNAAAYLDDRAAQLDPQEN